MIAITRMRVICLAREVLVMVVRQSAVRQRVWRQRCRLRHFPWAWVGSGCGPVLGWARGAGVELQHGVLERGHGRDALQILASATGCILNLSTHVVLCTLCIEHCEQHVAVAGALGVVCAEDLPHGRRRWLL